VKKLILACFFLVFSSIFFCAVLFAEEQQNLSENSEQKSFLKEIPKFNNAIETGTPLKFGNVPEISIFRLFFKVFITLIIILLFFYIIRKFILKRRKIFTDTSSELFQTLAIYPLSSNKSLQIIEFSDCLYLLAISDNNISLIEKIEDKDKIDTIKLYANMNVSEKEKQNFLNFFVNTFSKKYKKEYKIDDFKKIDDYE